MARESPILADQMQRCAIADDDGLTTEDDAAEDEDDAEDDVDADEASSRTGAITHSTHVEPEMLRSMPERSRQCVV